MMRPLLAVLVALALQDPKPRGYLGAQLADAEGGVTIVRVVAGGPAEAAGLKAGDLIVEVGGAAVEKTPSVLRAIQELGAGAELLLTIERDGKREPIRVALARHPQDLLEEPDIAEGLLKVRKILDRPYHEGAGAHEKHKLNLILPVTDKPFPILMWIHAGGWSFGERSGETALAVRLAERGIGVAAISHRLSAQDWFDPSMSKEGVKHPEHATDCARAFAWLHAHAKEHGGDPDRLYVAGHSSGGHLAALLALDEKHLKSAGLTIAAIKGAIPVGGAYDIPKYHAYLVRALGVEKADAHVTAVFGPPERWPDASPARYVKEARVPVLVITEEDEAFQAYKADFEGVVPEGSPIRFWTAADRKHDTVMVRMSQKGADVPRDRMIEFIRTGK